VRVVLAVCRPPRTDCARPDIYCNHGTASYRFVDCDGDGYIDVTCEDLANGERGVILSSEVRLRCDPCDPWVAWGATHAHRRRARHAAPRLLAHPATFVGSLTPRQSAPSSNHPQPTSQPSPGLLPGHQRLARRPRQPLPRRLGWVLGTGCSAQWIGEHALVQDQPCYSAQCLAHAPPCAAAWPASCDAPPLPVRQMASTSPAARLPGPACRWRGRPPPTQWTGSCTGVSWLCTVPFPAVPHPAVTYLTVLYHVFSWVSTLVYRT
jgi:hypothetical protein